MTIKTILITGSTDGIGKLLALKFAKENHEVILHGRNKEKLQQTIEEIKSKTNNLLISGFLADFSDLKSVKDLGNTLLQNLSKIDILVNNAGVFKSSSTHNSLGFDMRIMVNYFAPYILTNSILPLIQKSDKGRIINLSSAAQSSVSIDHLKGISTVSNKESYAQSKLALTMWSFYLAKKIKDITVIAVNPGSLLNTKMVKEAYGNHWDSADKGAQILFELSLIESYRDKTGLYFNNDQGHFENAHDDAYNESIIRDLIKTTEKLIN